MEITLEDTSKVVALMRSMELYSSASYVKDMSDRIATLDAEAGRVRAEAFKEAQEIADAIVLNFRLGESGHDAAKTISNLIFIEVRRAQKDAQAAASQPETEAEALTFENLNESTT